MAKIALVLLFTLALVLSIQSVIVEGAVSPGPATSQSPSSSTENAGEESSSFSKWATDQLRYYGLMSPKDSGSSAEAPGPAAYETYFGPGPAAE